ncbi:MAG: prepilin-type N-terminal cleavage/methylation domain-containing protein [Candidatus Zambryskibacteria bacterium]|nr:prepilin-type N-terminal cleavage/methylation domain-containing protein [Candidatus Zambryskibacteria bacterium]
MINPLIIHNRSLFKNKGFSLVEMLLYISILTVILTVIANALYSLNRSYRVIQSAEIIESSAITSLDRMVREIRDASSVDNLQSTFNTSPGVLTLNTTDDSGANMTIQFFVSNQIVRVKENGVDIGPLTDFSTRVTNLVFRFITTAQSKALKIEMTIESGQGLNYKSKKFYSTAVLRGSYVP